MLGYKETNPALTKQDRFIEIFEALFGVLKLSFDQNQQKAHQKAFDAFKKIGPPLKQQEDWKYTDLLAYLSFFEALKPNVPTNDNLTDRKQTALDFLKQSGLELTNGSFCFLYNGIPELFDPTVFSLKKLSFAESNSALGALNFAFCQNPISITLPAFNKEPIYILNITEPNDSPLNSHSKIQITAPENSFATIIEIHISLGTQKAFSNTDTTLELKENAKINHIFMQHSLSNSVHIGTVETKQEKHSHYTGTALLNGGLLNRASFTLNLEGENSAGEFYALETGNKSQKLDLHLNLQHSKSHTQSHTLLRGVMKDNAKGAFTGKIIVQEDSSSTQAHLENKNLLLSQGAEMNTRPQLEIYNDDVQCTHGATVGHLDPEALFYLKSRGIPEKEAKRLLIEGFIEPALKALPASIVHYVRNHFHGSE